MERRTTSRGAGAADSIYVSEGNEPAGPTPHLQPPQFFHPATAAEKITLLFTARRDCTRHQGVCVEARDPSQESGMSAINSIVPLSTYVYVDGAGEVCTRYGGNSEKSRIKSSLSLGHYRSNLGIV